MEENPTRNTLQETATSNNFKKESSILQVLFNAYSEGDNAEHEDVNRNFQNLYDLLDDISTETQDAVIDVVCNLCVACEYAGFVGGMQTAIRLVEELNI